MNDEVFKDKLEKKHKKMVAHFIDSETICILLLPVAAYFVYYKEGRIYIIGSVLFVVSSAMILLLFLYYMKKLGDSRKDIHICNIKRYMKLLGYSQGDIKQRQMYMHRQSIQKLSEIQVELENEKELQNEQNNMSKNKINKPLKHKSN
ncbi:hypothetical protein PZN54_11195 [Staphylococcus capitis]|uniref:hypothetical protein n=1 Tax=Staphylococcus capitis TaxID=29388 RepID=UPI00247FF7D6|nr:hypothetical protein [Staphylococcus capitis]MDH9600722.1 hypothetical protein [Staphylococcus capitis]MDH9624364.1 hypothetical protein [Staphylococcus capitis]